MDGGMELGVAWLRGWRGAGIFGNGKGEMELTVESLTGELGLELVSGQGHADAHVRWVHITELVDPTPWLKGGELLLSSGIQLDGSKTQHELIDRLVEHDIAGLGFGTGFAHKKVPLALVNAARKLSRPARYVSGYLAEGDGSRPHVWAEAHVDGVGWIGFDPLLGLSAGEDHARVASALDLAGIAMVSSG